MRFPPQEILAWLRELGLERYEQAFRENEIVADILPKLTTDDLKDIGVTIVGHRRKLLEAIAALAKPRQAGPSASLDASTAARLHAAERRQLIVMFVDLVGSTALSASLDPEEMSAAIRVYQNAVAGETLRFEGHIAKFMGDGVLSYFGWPQAHEDDAERACGLASPSSKPWARLRSAAIGKGRSATVVALHRCYRNQDAPDDR
jgi:class 3 adenylate cyclase